MKFCLSAQCSYVVCCFKCSSSLKSGRFWSAEKYHSESNSSDIVPLCHCRYDCSVDFPILTELEPLFKLYSYCYSYCLWCEQALRKSLVFGLVNLLQSQNLLVAQCIWCVYICMLNVYSGYTLGFFRWWERRDEHFVNYQGVFAGTHPDGPQPWTDVSSSPCPAFCHSQKNNRARSELSCSRDKRSWNWVQRLIWGGCVSQIHLWKWTSFFVVSS